MTEHVFYHNNGIIYQHADTQGQPTKSQEIERVTCEPYRDKSGDDGNRYGYAYCESGPDISHEEINQHHR
ncbi:hypothetical protein ES703_04885 [subsurface metagenome]